MIALRTMLDAVATPWTGLTGLASEVGRRVEHEAQVRLWEAKEPELFHKVQKHLKNTEATSTHKARVNINRFNELLKDGQFGFGWEYWPWEAHTRVGILLIDNIIRVTQWFTYETDPAPTFKPGQPSRPKIVVMPRQGLLDWVASRLDHWEETSPVFTPTIIPPRRWEGTRLGGYWTPYIKTPRLIRFKASQIDQKERAADEYEALDMPSRILAKGFDYIAVRDMAMRATVERELLPAELILDVCRKAPPKQLAEFSKVYGAPGSVGSLVHFLLKLPYDHDWAKELDEDYFPYPAETLEAFFYGRYETTSRAHTSTKHFKSRVMRDFGIDLGDITTHLGACPSNPLDWGALG